MQFFNNLKTQAMIHDKLTNNLENKRIEKWFSETYKNQYRSADEIQMLILFKLNQIEEKLRQVEYQTKTHWAN
jgi:hypothetical protein